MLNKSMEYTIKVVTNIPVDTAVLTIALKEIGGVSSAEVTNYRVKVVPRKGRPQLPVGEPAKG